MHLSLPSQPFLFLPPNLYHFNFFSSLIIIGLTSFLFFYFCNLLYLLHFLYQVTVVLRWIHDNHHHPHLIHHHHLNPSSIFFIFCKTVFPSSISCWKLQFSSPQCLHLSHVQTFSPASSSFAYRHRSRGQTFSLFLSSFLVAFCIIYCISKISYHTTRKYLNHILPHFFLLHIHYFSFSLSSILFFFFFLNFPTNHLHNTVKMVFRYVNIFYARLIACTLAHHLYSVEEEQECSIQV